MFLCRIFLIFFLNGFGFSCTYLWLVPSAHVAHLVLKFLDPVNGVHLDESLQRRQRPPDWGKQYFSDPVSNRSL